HVRRGSEMAQAGPAGGCADHRGRTGPVARKNRQGPGCLQGGRGNCERSGSHLHVARRIVIDDCDSRFTRPPNKSKPRTLMNREEMKARKKEPRVLCAARKS